MRFITIDQGFFDYLINFTRLIGQGKWSDAGLCSSGIGKV
jgi:hypothetical protein